MNARDALILDFSHLAEGQTVTGELCPSCGGGPSRDRALAVSRREGRLLWICYRASCGFRGVYGGEGAGNYTAPVSIRGATGRWVARESEEIPEDMLAMLYDKYHLTAKDVSKWKLGWHEDRLVLPALSLMGEEEGCTLRSLTGAKPKSLSHVDPGAMSWFRNRSSDSLVIVEDQLSAIRASKYVNAVALLGTNLNQDRATEIRKANFSTVMLALDADAFPLAIKYARQYRSYLPMTLLTLAKDIKDMTDEEAKALLQGQE